MTLIRYEIGEMFGDRLISLDIESMPDEEGVYKLFIVDDETDTILEKGNTLLSSHSEIQFETKAMLENDFMFYKILENRYFDMIALLS